MIFLIGVIVGIAVCAGCKIVTRAVEQKIDQELNVIPANSTQSPASSESSEK